MQFGNWTVTVNGIIWNKELQRFEIPADTLNTTKPQLGGTTTYEWILLATDEDWLTENDLYDLNFAFVYAIAKFGLAFDYDIFDATLAHQFEIFEAEDEEDQG